MLSTTRQQQFKMNGQQQQKTEQKHDKKILNKINNDSNKTGGGVWNSKQQNGGGGSHSIILFCTYCSKSFEDRQSLQEHCLSETHQSIIMSDGGRDWKWRPPPRGFTADQYALCDNYMNSSDVSSYCSNSPSKNSNEKSSGHCRYGEQCVEAHGYEELLEWRERFEYRRMRLQRAREKQLYGKSYSETILEKWIQSATPEQILSDRLQGVIDRCNSDLVTTVSSKTSKREWVFQLHSKRQIKAVTLLQDTHRNHFQIKQIQLVFDTANNTNNKKTNANKLKLDVQLTSNQEWCNNNLQQIPADNATDYELIVKVIFSTDIYGTFRQAIAFDFGGEPLLCKHLCVDCIPITDIDKIKEIRKEVVLSSSMRWDHNNSQIVTFSQANQLAPTDTTSGFGMQGVEWERALLRAYSTPSADTFQLTNSTIVEKRLSPNNYRDRMHELLFIEEMARYEQVARYNLTTKLRITRSYLLAPNGIATSTAKYSQSGELFALIHLSKDVSEDTSAGRLILNNCLSVLISAHQQASGLNEEDEIGVNRKGERKGLRKVYQVVIEDKCKNVIYLRLPAIAVKELEIKVDDEFHADVQFQLNRIPYCEWHYAIDKIADFNIIFPNITVESKLKPSADLTGLDPRLNAKQREAVAAITTPTECHLPPILIIGPFGTGKTYTLAQAIKQLLKQNNTRVLICTHSNSAADLYIKDYLHAYVEEGHKEATPLRIYYHKRWVSTVNDVVKKYCLIDTSENMCSFRLPTIEDINRHRVIVVTLSISMYLSTMGLEKGHFTHILLDEAAQAMECEAIMPLALANESTRIVLAGDHMQLSPELFSTFAKERGLHVSLLERLYDHYPTQFPCKILLCENYRAHEAIINFTSELFYDQKLIASGKQPRHDKYYPLTFFPARGEDVQDQNSTAFYNNSEVYEVVERVSELRKKWPLSWGKMDDDCNSIGIMTPYADQVFRIRAELRKRRMGGVSVERVLNVQGKQFRAIFLSTVRTRRTLPNISAATNQLSLKSTMTSDDDMNFGFLSNSKLLNTAITRAQSLVAVVGDPIALCTIGRCRKVWERFIDICHQNNSLYGITWSYLRSQLDSVELKKSYVLNPLAPEFVPRRYHLEAYIKIPSQQQTDNHNGNNQTSSQLMMLPPQLNGQIPLPTSTAANLINNDQTTTVTQTLNNMTDINVRNLANQLLGCQQMAANNNAAILAAAAAATNQQNNPFMMQQPPLTNVYPPPLYYFPNPPPQLPPPLSTNLPPPPTQQPPPQLNAAQLLRQQQLMMPPAPPIPLPNTWNGSFPTPAAAPPPPPFTNQSNLIELNNDKKNGMTTNALLKNTSALLKLQQSLAQQNDIAAATAFKTPSGGNLAQATNQLANLLQESTMYCKNQQQLMNLNNGSVKAIEQQKASNAGEINEELFKSLLETNCQLKTAAEQVQFLNNNSTTSNSHLTVHDKTNDNILIGQDTPNNTTNITAPPPPNGGFLNNISDMLSQPASVQIEWYRYLLEVGGMPMASKFMADAIQQQALMKTNKLIDKKEHLTTLPLKTNGSSSTTALSKLIWQQQLKLQQTNELIQQQQLNDKDKKIAIDQLLLMTGQRNRGLEPMANFNDNDNILKKLNKAPSDKIVDSSDMIKENSNTDNNSFLMQQQTVPLYRRQPLEQQTNEFQTPETILNGKPSPSGSSSSSFAGYARASINQLNGSTSPAINTNNLALNQVQLKPNNPGMSSGSSNTSSISSLSAISSELNNPTTAPFGAGVNSNLLTNNNKFDNFNNNQTTEPPPGNNIFHNDGLDDFQTPPLFQHQQTTDNTHLHEHISQQISQMNSQQLAQITQQLNELTSSQQKQLFTNNIQNGIGNNYSPNMNRVAQLNMINQQQQSLINQQQSMINMNLLNNSNSVNNSNNSQQQQITAAQQLINCQNYQNALSFQQQQQQFPFKPPSIDASNDLDSNLTKSILNNHRLNNTGNRLLKPPESGKPDKPITYASVLRSASNNPTTTNQMVQPQRTFQNGIGGGQQTATQSSSIENDNPLLQLRRLSNKAANDSQSVNNNSTPAFYQYFA